MVKDLIAVGYDRVSTKRQANEGIMLEARAESIPLYCAARGWKLSKYLTDPGVSGREGKKRPGFEKAMELACRPGRVLVVDSLSRFVRSVIDADRALRRLHEAGGEIAIVNLGIDTTTASGKLVFRVISAVAEFESDQIGERVRAANAFSVKKFGYRRMGVQPAGWTINDDGDRVEVEAELAVIRRCRDLVTTMNAEQAAAVLTAERVPTISALRGKGGGTWAGRRVRDLLKSSAESSQICEVG